MTIDFSIGSEEQIQSCDLSQTKPRNGFPARAVLHLVSACLLSAFSCGIGQSSFARDFVVACTETASDENEGTVESPLRTIGAAIRAAEPGDVVSVLAGDYRSEENGFGAGVIPVTNSGARKNPIRIKAAANNDVIVGKFLLSNCHDIVIQGFQVRGLDFSTIDGWQPMPSIVRNPNANLPRPDFTQPFETREAQMREEFATYFSLVEQLDFSTGIDLENCQRVNVFRNDIRGYFGGVQCRGCSQIKIHFNVIRDCTNGIFTFYASDGTTPGVIGASIRYNDIQQSLDNGIDIRAGSEAVQIDDNYVAFSGRSHISLQGAATRCKVQNNAALRGGFYSETMEFPGSSGISLNKGNRFTFSLHHQFTDEIPLTDTNDLNSESFNIFGGQLRYQIPISNTLNLTANLGVNNLFDTNYARSVLINAVGFGGAQPRFFFPGNGRNYYGGIVLKYALAKY